MKLTIKQQTLFEIILVLGVMLLVKDILDRFNAIGAGSIAMWCGILVATIFMRKKGTTWRDKGLLLPVGRKSWLRSLGLSFIVIVLVFIFLGVVTPIISELLGVGVPERSTERFEFLLGKPVIFAAYLLVVIWIGAALGEELLMRGFLLNGFIALFGEEKQGKSVAVILHAIIFGMLHISQGVPGIIGTAGVAIIFATVYLLNGGKLLPLIIAHGVINSIGLFGYYFSNGNIN